jgi:hypothetical protein
VGAALATFISYLAVFIIRAVDTRRYIRVNINAGVIAMTLALLVAQSLITLFEVRFWVGWQIIIFLLILICNIRNVRFILKGTGRILTKPR